MAVVRFEPRLDVLKWAIMSSGRPVNELNEKYPKISEWLDQSSAPTINQIESLSNYLRIPMGYFFLRNVPEEKLPLLQFRTIGSLEEDGASRELLDIISDMETQQEWMRGHLLSHGAESLLIVGSLKNNNSDGACVDYIRKSIGIDLRWAEHCASKREAYNYIREKISASGIIVMQNGVVRHNTHRPLNLDEFRAFTLIDDIAPLIFINSTDAEAGKIFSLLHELAHVYMGVSSIYNDNSYDQRVYSEYNNIEKACNAIAAELYVPSESFLKAWNNTEFPNKTETIKSLATHFKCSNIVIARRALDHNKISKQVYQEIATETKRNFYIKKDSSGGNFNYTAATKYDKNFINALVSSVQNGASSYTEAFNLTHLNRVTFDNLARLVAGNSL